MTTRKQNETLTRTGPGTPMGTLFRRYWIPALLAEELPEPDCEQVQVRILSEPLLAFRDSQGRVGLIDEFCAHRRVSLWYGRVEQDGIRCAYHGWKYDVTGRCIEVPSESDAFCRDVKLKSYPCVERGGVIWTYMGPPELQPPPPDFEWMVVPDSHRYVSKRWQESNYLQAMEGGIDGAHVSWLHSGALVHEPMRAGSKGAEYQRDNRPKIHVMDTPTGVLIGARRNAEADQAYWRVTQWLMPWYSMIPPYGDHALHGHAWVPIDDENCFAWTMTHHPTRPLSQEEHAAMQDGEGIYAKLIPGTWRPVQNRQNRYLMDRAAQRSGRYYSGVPGIAMQDASLQESAGPIVDRSEEYLASTDMGIVKTRNRLLKAAKDLAEGIDPPALDPAAQRVRSASFVKPAAMPFREAVKDVIEAGAEVGVAHLTI
jgi:phenylpropionate dioxygenase-like ring-hydroxylating dioxygenase large terminal subunit